MQIPAYWPALWGVKAVDQSGVVVEVKNVIAIESADIIVMEEDVEVAIAMPSVAVEAMSIDTEVAIDIALVGVEAISIVIDMSIFSGADVVILTGYREKRLSET